MQWLGQLDLALQKVRDGIWSLASRWHFQLHKLLLETFQLLEALLHDEQRVLTVSTTQTGTAGVDGVALSLPTVVGAGGALSVIEPDMDDAEREGLGRSAEVLRTAMAEARGD